MSTIPGVMTGKEITWTLTGPAGATLTIEYFSNTVPDPSGFGEGEKFLGERIVTIEPSGSVVLPRL